MRIAIVINFFKRVDTNITSTSRAVASVAYLLCEELVKRNHEVTLFDTSDSQTSAKIAPGLFNSQDPDIIKCAEYISGSISEDKTQQTDKLLYEKYLQEANINIVKQASNFDIIHTHDLFVQRSLASYVKDIPIPVVSTLHGARMVYESIAANHFFIAISKAQKNLYPSLPIVGIAYNGIRIADYEFSETPKDYLVFLGRITPDKGTLEAIEVAKKTKKELFIAGALDHAYPEYVKKCLQEIESHGNIHFIGGVDSEKKNALLRSAFATLMPIQWEEPFGLVAAESLACGTPVIALRKGALPEIIENGITGYIVDDVDQICAMLEKVKDITRKKCRESVEENFTVATMTDAYEQLYKKVLNS